MEKQDNVKDLYGIFNNWFSRVFNMAMSQEWILDYEPEYWMPKFKRNLTPEQALEEYWAENFNEISQD